MTTASELIVKLKPEGVDETTDGLEDAQQSFEETAETAEEESSQLEEFSQRFKGSLAVATTALAIAAGGILAQVPVIREAFSGLEAIMTEVGLAIDSLLRDLGFEGVTQGLFDVADALGDADDSTRDFIAGLTLLATGLIGAQIAAYGLSTAIGAFKSTLVGGAIAEAISGIVGAIGLLGGAIIGAIVLAGLFLAAYAANFRGTRDVTNNVVESWISIIKAGLNLIVDLAKGAFDVLVAAWDFVKANLIRIGKEAGNGLVRIFTGWVNSARQVVVNGMNFIIGKIEDTVNRGIRRINMLSDALGIEEMAQVSLTRISDPEALAAPQPFQPRSQQEIRQEFRGRLAASGRQGRQDAQQFASAVGDELREVLPDEIVNQINVDGRELTKEIEKFFGSSVANRGR